MGANHTIFFVYECVYCIDELNCQWEDFQVLECLGLLSLRNWHRKECKPSSLAFVNVCTSFRLFYGTVFSFPQPESNPQLGLTTFLRLSVRVVVRRNSLKTNHLSHLRVA